MILQIQFISETSIAKSIAIAWCAIRGELATHFYWEIYFRGLFSRGSVYANPNIFFNDMYSHHSYSLTIYTHAVTLTHAQSHLHSRTHTVTHTYILKKARAHCNTHSYKHARAHTHTSICKYTIQLFESV